MNHDRPHELEVILGCSFNHRRKPRVRLRKGRYGLYHVLEHRRTKRAAFRAARHRRDERGERRPLCVWWSGLAWCVGYRTGAQRPTPTRGPLRAV